MVAKKIETMLLQLSKIITF